VVSFAGIGREELLRRARELVPRLKQHARQCEELRRMPDETERELHERGIFRILQPQRVGGAELDLVTLVDICEEVAQACPSTAWNIGNLASHHWMLGYFPPPAQDEIWNKSPDTLIATSLAFPCGRGRKEKGGYLVSGRWPFSSGVDNSGWNMLAVTVRDGDKVTDQRFALLHRSEYEIIDNWFALGLGGTGSKDVAAEEVFVPDYRTIGVGDLAGGAHPGAAANPGPLFRMPFLAIGVYVLTGVALGCARGAYEGYVGAAKKRNTTYGGTPVGGFQAVQIKVAEAAALIDAAALIMRHHCRQATEIAERGETPSLDDKLRWRRDAAWTVRACRDAVDLVMGLSGAGGLYNSGEMQRYFRDAHAIAAHIMYAFDVQGTMFGQHALGIPGPPPVL
jgi:3-hydroxy-9,10-secoandrosta-1,3,5(10)-triene-9,17-dione monooxygenase